MKTRFFFCYLFLFLALFGIAEEAWILKMGDTRYGEAEELFINEGMVPVFDEKPLIAEDLIRQLNVLIGKSKSGSARDKAKAIIDSLTLPFPFVSPILESAFHGGYNSETDRFHFIKTYDREEGSPVLDKEYLDFRAMYEVNNIPSILTFGLIANYGGFALLLQPELRAGNSNLLEDYHLTNFPSELVLIDNTFPRRGIVTYYKSPIEARFGRGKLHVGPGKWSTLGLTQYMPYFDYAKARFFHEWFSLSAYLISLNPTITINESDYLEDMYENDTNPESNAIKNGKSYIERSKHLAVTDILISPLPWFLIRISQMNLVGGRDPDISDFNPLMVFHNLYKEGTYSVPLSVSATVAPYKGIKLYADYYFYDLELGDETGISSNPGGAAYQGGFTFLSTPFFKAGPGRFRLDGEISYVEPWVYGKFYSLRQFDSLIIYPESYVGRFWVEYPLGFYLGPDVVDLNLSLSYGIPGVWDVSLYWNMSGKG
ncbi:MAG: hypothetical protein JXJ04_04195, partial [Spirochaetales bacterium]|nr:hypothetical protein [Spirochaetales bacterium]